MIYGDKRIDEGFPEWDAALDKAREAWEAAWDEDAWGLVSDFLIGARDWDKYGPLTDLMLNGDGAAAVELREACRAAWVINRAGNIYHGTSDREVW